MTRRNPQRECWDFSCTSYVYRWLEGGKVGPTPLLPCQGTVRVSISNGPFIAKLKLDYLACVLFSFDLRPALFCLTEF